MSQASWQIRPETQADAPAITALNEAGFGPGRFAKSAYRLREGVDPVASLSRVAVEDDVLRGSVRFWPILVGGHEELLLGSVRFWPIRVGGHEELLLGPLAVRGDQRGKGIGIALMQAGIEKAKQGPWRGILLVGDEPYYAKVGFSRLPPGRVRFPGPVDQDRILGLSLKEGEMLALTGQVRRARNDDANCADGAAFG
jgi:predicted N-acetyltransferase YhbS